ncbi:NAD(P)-dependent oxidoreductase [Amycolatopsis sp. NPDC088138]|uniref:NAD(P)-dependent oxidoreductase n=1 Tax=Amycolatopsis sp. NPDC088138 TaxID=3363938 RepID=UPI00380C23A9
MAVQIRAGRLRTALDVTGPEPLPKDHPLKNCPGAIISPHSARTVPGTNALCYKVAVDQVTIFLVGKVPPNAALRHQSDGCRNGQQRN